MFQQDFAVLPCPSYLDRLFALVCKLTPTSEILHLQRFLVSQTLLSWLMVAAEILVALVIYLELEQNRRLSFLDKATGESADQDRRKIYEQYVQLGEFADLEQRSKAFVQKMYQDPELKLCCDRQIAIFNDLGITIEEWFSRKKPLVRVFPHAALHMWLILNPYILERRADSGDWFARPLLKFTLRCVKFVLKDCHSLRLRGVNREDIIEIPVEYIRKMQDQLQGLI